jgi:hypothetical protein
MLLPLFIDLQTLFLLLNIVLKFVSTRGKPSLQDSAIEGTTPVSTVPKNRF